MKRYDSISSLISDFMSLPIPGGIFVESEKVNNLSSAFFITTADSEERNADFIEDEWGRRLPVFLKNESVKSWLDTATFQDIISLKLENNDSLSINDVDTLVSAVEYYLENDDFED